MIKFLNKLKVVFITWLLVTLLGALLITAGVDKNLVILCALLASSLCYYHFIASQNNHNGFIQSTRHQFTKLITKFNKDDIQINVYNNQNGPAIRPQIYTINTEENKTIGARLDSFILYLVIFSLSVQAMYGIMTAGNTALSTGVFALMFAGIIFFTANTISRN